LQAGAASPVAARPDLAGPGRATRQLAAVGEAAGRRWPGWRLATGFVSQRRVRLRHGRQRAGGSCATARPARHKSLFWLIESESGMDWNKTPAPMLLSQKSIPGYVRHELQFDSNFFCFLAIYYCFWLDHWYLAFGWNHWDLDMQKFLISPSRRSTHVLISLS
jgi:hypothetical protein